MSLFYEKMKYFEKTGGYNLLYGNRKMCFKYIAALKISHVFRRTNYKIKLDEMLLEAQEKNKLSSYKLRWYEEDTRVDSVAFVQFANNMDNLTIIKFLDGKWFGEGEEGKFLAVKPNGFASTVKNDDYPNCCFRLQLDAIKRFNDHHYVCAEINKPNINLVALKKLKQAKAVESLMAVQVVVVQFSDIFFTRGLGLQNRFGPSNGKSDDETGCRLNKNSDSDDNIDSH